MYTYSLVFQVIDNSTRIHIKDIRVTIKRIRQVERETAKEVLIARAKQEAEKRLFDGMVAKAAKAMNTTTEDVIRAEKQGLLFVCIPYSVKYVGMTEK